MKNKNGFTLVELIVVIAIIAVIATLVVVNFNGLRVSSRDAQRVNNIHEIQTALEIYYNKYRSYPTTITAGQTFSYNGIAYIDPVPSNPSPRNDGRCPNHDYTYNATANNTSYILSFCLGKESGDYDAGELSCYGNGSCNPDNNGLVGWWKFDEGSGSAANDTSGNNNNGTLVSNPTWQGGTNCKVANCLAFGGNNLVTINDSSTLDLKNNFTISLWMKSNLLSQTNRYLIGKLNNAGVDNVYSIIYGYHANQVQFYGPGSSYGYPSSNSNMTITDTNWHHIVYTYDGSVYRGYFDSVAITPVTVSSALTMSSGALNIGGFNPSMYFFYGSIDDVRIYNRALTATEILSLYYRTR